MLSFIVCEDNKNVMEIYENLLNKITMPYDFNYQIHKFEKYDSKLKSLIGISEELKIYILDLELPGKSGIDIAREIRKNDWDSPIIILTSHDELELRLLKQKLLILDFISKFEDYEQRLTDTINMILKRKRSKNTICVKSNKEIYNLKLDSIYYIYRDNVEEKIMFVTTLGTYPVRSSLVKIKEKLSNNFEQSHKACIVNKDKISRIDSKNNIIYFEDDIKTDLLSQKYKKNFREVV